MLVTRIYNGVHSHSAQDILNATMKIQSKFLSEVMKRRFLTTTECSINYIRTDFVNEYGLQLTYKQGWRCKEKAIADIYGERWQSYMLIPWWCERAMAADVYTKGLWTSSSDYRFQQLFLAYGCSINGFINGCRPLLYIDGCHLSGPYCGTLLSATAFDANNNMYPIAYVVVSGEVFSDWWWLLNELKTVIGDVNVSIITDRHAAIKGAVGSVFGSSQHAFCYRHIKEDFSTQVGRHCIGRKNAKNDAHLLLDAIAYARLADDYNLAFDNLWAFCSQLASWVENDSDIDRWAMSKFCMKLWDNITSNLAESFNSWIVKERQHNIFQFIQEHYKKLAGKIIRHKLDLCKWSSLVGPRIEKKLLENVAWNTTLSARHYGANYFLVTVNDADVKVNLTLRQCTCKEWDMTRIPCQHACAAVRVFGGNVYSYVDECFFKTTQEKIYQHTMVLIETHGKPDLTDLLGYMSNNCDLLFPPSTSNPPGRP